MRQTLQQPPRRSRPLFMLMAFVVALLGLATRKYSAALPVFIGTYAPDALWALLLFLLLALLPRLSIKQAAYFALTAAYFIEFSQLYQAPWLNAIRDTKLGGLILGHGFLWSDLLCYAVGIGVGTLLARGLTQENNEQTIIR